MTAPVRLVLTMTVDVRDDVSLAEWSCLLGQALDHLRPALHPGSVPEVRTSKAPTNRAAIRSQVRAQLDAAEDSANERLAGAGAAPCPGCNGSRVQFQRFGRTEWVPFDPTLERTPMPADRVRACPMIHLGPEPVLTTQQQSAAAANARDVVDRDVNPQNVRLCRCTHAHDRHDRIAEGEQRRGACAAWGCKCGLFRSVEKVANANAGGRR